MVKKGDLFLIALALVIVACFVFIKPTFTGYTTIEGTVARLYISDQTDTTTKYPGDLVRFYAYYTNITSGEFITGECNITFKDFGTHSMEISHAAGEDFYYYQRTFPSNGTFYYNITCTNESYETLTANDSAFINETPHVARLNISDTTDTTTKYPGDLVRFYAYYTNITSGEFITGECNITFEDSGTHNMSIVHGTEEDYYRYQRTFSSNGTFAYNVTCTNESYETLTANDSAFINETPHVARLNISDTTDTTTKYPGDLVRFYAYYTNITSGEFITGECNITFKDFGTHSMEISHAAGEDFYYYQRTFPSNGTFYYNITCTNESYETLTAEDNVTITPFSCIGTNANFSCGQTITESCSLVTDINASGRCFTIGASNIVVDGNNHKLIGSGSGEAFFFSGSYNNITLKNFAAQNFGYGVYLGSSSNNTISELNLTSNVYGVYIYNGQNNIIKDTKITNSSNKDIYFYSATQINNTFLNTSYTDSKVNITENATAFFKWYLDFEVQNSSGSGLKNANVTISDKNSNLIYNGLTNSYGEIPRLNLIGYEQKQTTKIYYSNYTINASKSGYYSNSKQINLTGNIDTYLTLSVIPPSSNNSNKGGGNTAYIPPAPKEIIIDFSQKDTTDLKLSKNGKATIKFRNGQTHTLRLVNTNVFNKECVVEISSNPKNYTLKVGETIQVDADGDGTKDLEITAKTAGTQWTFSLKELTGAAAQQSSSQQQSSQQPQQEQSSLQQQPAAQQPAPQQPQQEQPKANPPKEGPKTSYNWAYILLAIAVGFAILISIFTTRKHIKKIEEEPKIETQAPQPVLQKPVQQAIQQLPKQEIPIQRPIPEAPEENINLKAIEEINKRIDDINRSLRGV